MALCYGCHGVWAQDATAVLLCLALGSAAACGALPMLLWPQQLTYRVCGSLCHFVGSCGASEANERMLIAKYGHFIHPTNKRILKTSP